MNRIKELRKKHGLSQQELADALHVHQTAVSQWENGKTAPDLDNLQQMAKLFGVSTDYILGQSKPTPSIPAPQLSDIDFALSGEIRELTDDEKQDLLDYVRFKLSQRGRK